MATVNEVGRDQKRSIVGKVLIAVSRLLFLPFFAVWNQVTQDGLKVTVVSHSNLIFLWPVPIVSAIFVWMLQTGYSPETIGWLWIGMGLVVTLAFLDRLTLLQALVIILAYSVLGLAGWVVELKFNIPILKDVWDYFAKANVQADPGTLTAVGKLSALLIAIYALPAAFLSGKYRISSRKIDHQFALNLEDTGLGASALTPSHEVPNVIKAILGFGAGSVVFKAGKQPILRIDNVLGLWFVYPSVEKIFDSITTHSEK